MRALTLWPLLLKSVVQEDHIRLFELDDVVTLPVVLIDLAKATGWPAHLGVQTSITRNRDDRWVTTADGLSCQTDVTGPVGTSVAIRAALDVPMMTIGPFSFVTGTVRRIELVSAVRRAVKPGEPDTLTEHWTLTDTPVAPVFFRYGRDPGDVWDWGVVVHLGMPPGWWTVERWGLSDLTARMGFRCPRHVHRMTRSSAVRRSG